MQRRTVWGPAGRAARPSHASRVPGLATAATGAAETGNLFARVEIRPPRAWPGPAGCPRCDPPGDKRGPPGLEPGSGSRSPPGSPTGVSAGDRATPGSHLPPPRAPLPRGQLKAALETISNRPRGPSPLPISDPRSRRPPLARLHLGAPGPPPGSDPAPRLTWRVGRTGRREAAAGGRWTWAGRQVQVAAAAAPVAVATVASQPGSSSATASCLPAGPPALPGEAEPRLRFLRSLPGELQPATSAGARPPSRACAPAARPAPALPARQVRTRARAGRGRGPGGAAAVRSGPRGARGWVSARGVLSPSAPEEPCTDLVAGVTSEPGHSLRPRGRGRGV